jgi:hypothetical protein
VRLLLAVQLQALALPKPDFCLTCAAVDTACSYKFCVAMENSVARDYITEKLWQALQAGCVPIYLGSPTARGVVPDPNSIIV